MPHRVVSLESHGRDTAQTIRDAFAALRKEMDLPLAFPPEVEAEADAIITRITGAGPQQVWPDHAVDTLDIEFITIDPAGSMDLDQALHLAATESGFVVHYAIADVAAFVDPGGAIDAEARVRGTTMYAPDGRTPLHPPTLSEGAASLLPGMVRPAAVWTIELERSGKISSIAVARGLVRSRARFSYVRAQQLVDDLVALGYSPGAGVDGALGVGEPEERIGLDTLALLAVVGPLRIAVERERGGVSLNVPEQEVEHTEQGEFELSFRTVLPVEDFNAQISLLTGIAAAQLMLKGRVGLLRTLPPADPRDLKRLRRTAHALGLNWPRATSYGEFLDTLDSSQPRHAAFQHEATTLFRGANYLAFAPALEGAAEQAESDAGKHNAIGAHYAHVTAPLRRLGDRFTTEICLAVSAGYEVPQWVLDALPQLPQLLNDATRRANSYGRATTDIVEAAVLSGRVGQSFTGVIVELDDRNNKRGDVMLSEPAVHGQVTGSATLPLGEIATVVLTEADLEKRKVRFSFESPESEPTRVPESGA